MFAELHQHQLQQPFKRIVVETRQSGICRKEKIKIKNKVEEGVAASASISFAKRVFTPARHIYTSSASAREKRKKSRPEFFHTATVKPRNEGVHLVFSFARRSLLAYPCSTKVQKKIKIIETV